MSERGTKRTVRIFGVASFLNDLGSDMIYPIWPLFVTGVLGANMAILGLIDGIGDVFVSFSQAASGYLSDRIRKRKIFIWTGYLLGALSRTGYAVSTTWAHLIPFRILDRAGKIRAAPRDAIIADVSTQQNRGSNFGFLRMMDNLGAACGIIICILFFKLLGYRNLFFLAAIPSALAVLLILSFVKETKPATKPLYHPPSLKVLDKNARLFLILSAVFALGSFSYSFLLLFAAARGFRVAFVPVLYLIFTAAASLSSIPFGNLADKVGRKIVLMLSFVLWGAVCLAFVFFRTHSAIILGFVLYGLHKGALDTVQRTFVSELAPTDYRASALGGFSMVVGLCALPASLIAGLLWDKISIATPFAFSLSLTIISIVMLAFVKEK